MENNNNEIVSTPMEKVWKVICATMLGTVLIGYAWHSSEMFKLRAQNEHAENEVRANIVKLTIYRDQLRTEASSTIQTLTQ